MSGICSYLSNQRLINWCSAIDFTGARTGIAITIIVILALPKIQAYLAPSLQGRVSVDKPNPLRAGADKLLPFLNDAFVHSEAKQQMAKGFIKSPEDLIGQLYTKEQTQTLWKILLQTTITNLIQSQLDEFGSVNQELLELAEINSSDAWKLKFNSVEKSSKTLVYNSFIEEIKRLAKSLSADNLQSANLQPEMKQLLMVKEIAKPVQQILGKEKEEEEGVPIVVPKLEKISATDTMIPIEN